jgi:hypothetical protein
MSWATYIAPALSTLARNFLDIVLNKVRFKITFVSAQTMVLSIRQVDNIVIQ